MPIAGLRYPALAAALAAGALVSGCAVAPATTKTVTTLGQVDMTGMVCRRETATGTTLRKTTCATQAAWDKHDAAAIAFSEQLHEESNRQTNVDQFGRMRN